MQLDKYIYELLFYHDCVIVPDFGAFIAKYEPAKIDFQRKVIFPPSKKIAFNPSLNDNDALLIHHISRKENLSYPDISEELRKLISSWNKILSKGEKITIRNIGILALNEEGKIVFSRLNSKNFLLDSFGLSEVSIKPVNRRKIITERQSKSSQIVGKTKKKLYYSIPVSAMFFICLWAILLFNSPISQFDKSNLNFLFDDTTISMIDNEKTEIISPENIKEKPSIDTPKVDKVSQEVVTQEVMAEFNGASYYIIGGAFQYSENAKGYQQQLLIKNHQSEIIHSNKGLFLVTYRKFRTRKEALNILERIKARDNKEAWILKQ